MIAVRSAFVFSLVICFAATLSCGRSAQTYIERAKRFYDEGKYEESALNCRKAIYSIRAPVRRITGSVLRN